MRNPFAKPRTIGQWLLGSVCWTVAGVGGWVIVVILLTKYLTVAEGELALPVSMPAFWLAYVLVWLRAIKGGNRLLYSPEACMTVIGAVATLWLVLLLFYQLLILPLGLLMTAVLAHLLIPFP